MTNEEEIAVAKDLKNSASLMFGDIDDFKYKYKLINEDKYFRGDLEEKDLKDPVYTTCLTQENQRYGYFMRPRLYLKISRTKTKFTNRSSITTTSLPSRRSWNHEIRLWTQKFISKNSKMTTSSSYMSRNFTTRLAGTASAFQYQIRSRMKNSTT